MIEVFASRRPSGYSVSLELKEGSWPFLHLSGDSPDIFDTACSGLNIQRASGLAPRAEIQARPRRAPRIQKRRPERQELGINPPAA